MSVYFITCRQTGTVKIGSSLEPHARLKELQTAHPFELTVEAVLPGGTEEEFDFHRRFSEERLKGEWFRITDMIELIIKNNPAPPPPDLNKIASERAEAIRMDPKERAYVAAIEAARHRRAIPRPKPLTPYEKRERQQARREMNRRYSAGDIHFPFRGKTY